MNTPNFHKKQQKYSIFTYFCTKKGKKWVIFSNLQNHKNRLLLPK